jgi:hypothetical protein
VTAGQSGAPAGFDIEWMTLADYIALGNQWPVSSDVPDPQAPSFCKASFNGEGPNCSKYSLGSGQSVTVVIGDDNLYDDSCSSSPCAGHPLLCNTAYVFRIFAHGDPKSDFGETITCATLPCITAPCTYTQGYWGTHGSVDCAKGNNQNVWPVTSLIVGTTAYNATELCSIFQTQAMGNGLIALAHQLIAAKLNIANGAPDTDVAVAISDADTLIGSFVISPVGDGYLSPADTSALTEALTQFNEGTIGPGHCNN